MVLVTVRASFARLMAGSVCGRSSGGAVRGAGVQSLAFVCYLGSMLV